MSYLKSKKSTLGADSREVLETVPHIFTNMLYPAVANVMVDGSTALSAVTTGPNGSTVTSSKYGTVQSDGRMYYYTDIKGSKPIKDPRIGSHFGSQRHPCDSLQLLEQETATHGNNVHSIDGREWLRAVGGPKWTVANDANGNRLGGWDNTTEIVSIEIVGYFNDINIAQSTDTTDRRSFVTSLNGSADSAENNTYVTTAGSPLGDRYVDKGSVVNLGLPSTHSATLGINTLMISNHSNADFLEMTHIELIAQDTTSTATKSQIQIPSQNVVSYGKKYTVEGTPHYNPFAFKTDGTTAWTSGNHNSTAWPVGTGSSTNIDTATSLGLAAWVSTNYYYPYNGGRVVKWIASDGTIKTSVNMMPPNARNIGPTAISEKGDDSAGTSSAAVANDTYLPTFTDIAMDHSQAEIAKTFHWREFGNGAANGGTGATYADATMVNARDNIAYVMDDGLTSFSSVDAFMCGTGDLCHDDTLAEMNWFTFIGTGVNWISTTASGNAKNITVAQNLPYGTHILKMNRSGNNELFAIDGVAISGTAFGTYGSTSELAVHQPKRPPIPENAVVLADYMLMADYVEQTGDPEGGKISKGVRSCCGGRDVFADDSSFTANASVDSGNVGPWGIYSFRSGSQATAKLPYFGTAVNTRMQNTSLAQVITIDGGSAITTTHLNNGSEEVRDIKTMSVANSGVAVGSHTVLMTSSTSYVGRFIGFDVVSPIHTSSHYQPFETPFLYELVGGDRNMEQTNLVVTPDGKTWDEVTRDTSYMGTNSLSTNVEDENHTNTTTTTFSEWRGTAAVSFGSTHFNKHFAIAYDRYICLYEGQYQFCVHSGAYASSEGRLLINGTIVTKNHDPSTGTNAQLGFTVYLHRGDYWQWSGTWLAESEFQAFLIHKI